VSADGGWVRYSARNDERFFVVAPDGRLLDPPSGVQPAQPASSWQDCCIVNSLPVKGRPAGTAEPLPPLRPWDSVPSGAGQDSQGERAPRKDLYLVGPWPEVAVDPSLWGHTGEPLTDFCVKEAVLRMKRIRAIRELQGRYSPCDAVAPALWGSGAADAPDANAIQLIASRQVRVFAAKIRVPPRPRLHVSDADLVAIYRQPWMEPSPSRPSPDEREAQRRADASTPAAPAPPGDRDDNADAVQKWDDGRPAWRKAWTEAQRKRKPRAHRVFAWQLLHDALPVGAAKAAFIPAGAQHLAPVVCCGNPACRPAAPNGSASSHDWSPETLPHALIYCPAVRPAVTWLADLWFRIDGGSPPPLHPSVWLQGSDEVWRPQRQSHADLWHTLRVSLLAAAWKLRTRRMASGEAFGPSAVVDDCVADIRRLVLADWQVVSGPCTDMAGTHSSWFPGRTPAMDRAEFEARWCAGGVIAHVRQGPGGRGDIVEFRLEAAASGVLASGSGGGGGGPG